MALDNLNTEFLDKNGTELQNLMKEVSVDSENLSIEIIKKLTEDQRQVLVSTQLKNSEGNRLSYSEMKKTKFYTFLV